MATPTKIIAIGISAGIILPKDVLAEMNVEKGDTLYLAQTPQGAYLTPYNEEFASKLEAGDRVMRKYRDALKKLAE